MFTTRYSEADLYKRIKRLNMLGVEICFGLKTEFINPCFENNIFVQQVRNTPIGIGNAFCHFGPHAILLFEQVHMDSLGRFALCSIQDMCG